MADRKRRDITQEERAEDANVFVDALSRAVEDHIRFQSEAMVPGFVSFVCDVDVDVALYRLKIPAGVYFVKSGDDINDALVYVLRLEEDETGEELDGEGGETELGEDGTVMRAIKEQHVNVSAVIQPIETGEKTFLGYIEYTVWLAMGTAETSEERDKIFNAAYQVTSETEILPPTDAEQDGKKPETRYQPLTKLHDNLTNPTIYELGLRLNVAGRMDKRQVKTFVALEVVEDDEGMSLSRELNDFDIQVYNSIASLWEAGKRDMTLQEIATMTMGEGKPGVNQLAELEECVELLRRTKMTADFSQEVKAFKLTDPETGDEWSETTVDDFILSAARIRMKSANGKVAVGYTLNAMPILYKYAKAKKQVTSYPTKYLDTREVGSNTKRNVVIKTYLLKRIAQAKGNPKMSRTIRCEKIYAKAGINAESRTERNRVNKFVVDLMDKWARDGLIKGYEVIGEGRQKMTKIAVRL